MNTCDICANNRDMIPVMAEHEGIVPGQRMRDSDLARWESPWEMAAHTWTWKQRLEARARALVHLRENQPAGNDRLRDRYGVELAILDYVDRKHGESA